MRILGSCTDSRVFSCTLADSFGTRLGVLLIAAGVLLLLAVSDVAVGSRAHAGRRNSCRFGWDGAYLRSLAPLGAGGVMLLKPPSGRVAWGRIFCFEIAALLGLGLLSILGGSSLVRADAGLDGGRLGWGIAFMVTTVPGLLGGSAVLAASMLLFAAAGAGLLARVERRLAEIAGEQPRQLSPRRCPLKSEARSPDEPKPAPSRTTRQTSAGVPTRSEI